MPKVDKELLEELKRRNREIDAERERIYEESMGVQAALFLNLPPRLTIMDLMREKGIQIPEFNLAVLHTYGWQTFENIAELAVELKVNLGRKELMAILDGNFLGMEIIVGDCYEPELRAYANSFQE